MPKKRENKNKSPIAKKTKYGPIDSLLKKNEQDTSDSLNSVLNKPNICGETDVETMNELINEWIQTEEDLLDEDVAYLNKFFLDLAREKDENKLKLIIDNFYNSVSKREINTNEWKQMYNDIIRLISSDLQELNIQFFN